MALQAINPANGEALATYEEMAIREVQQIIAEAHRAHLGWRATSFRERTALMRNAAEVLRGSARDYARLMAEEMGKPIRDGIAEAQKCAIGCDYYAENAERFLAPEPVKTEARKSFVAFNPEWCWRSCRGTSHSGRSSVSRPRGSWPATPRC
jgi:succinate-semialdehyde dehydrogenase / glutarate-semialdehyde dehydrogenase